MGITRYSTTELDPEIPYTKLFVPRFNKVLLFWSTTILRMVGLQIEDSGVKDSCRRKRGMTVLPPESEGYVVLIEIEPYCVIGVLTALQVYLRSTGPDVYTTTHL